MRRRSEGVRVNGPYKHGRKFRVQFSRGSGGDRTSHYETFSTRAAAEACADAARNEATGATVKAAVDQFLAEKTAAGRAPATITTYEDRLQLLLGPVMGRPIRSVLGRAAELYAATWTTPAGKPRAADTHQHGLLVGRLWGRWCVKRQLLRVNPFADVEPVGCKVLGADKERLTVDESRKLADWCTSRPGDPGAVITLAYLLLGPRASELVKRDVRDLDDNGRLLWIGKTKSKAGRRRLRIPEELRLMLLALASGRAADEPLFVRPDGVRWSRHVARRRVREALDLAGVPVMPPQALRRTQATLATEAGETGLAVARHLGHATGEAPAVTGRSYVGRDAVTDLRVERARRAIEGR